MAELNEPPLNEPNQAHTGPAEEGPAEDGCLDESDGEKFLCFRLGAAVYAVELIRIKEIIEYNGVTRIPMTPPSIRGVLNLRGNVVPVVDLAERIGCHSRPASRRTCVIITEMQDEDGPMDIGFVVDAVEQVVVIEHEDVEPPPSFGTSINCEYIAGMGKVHDEFIVLLNMDTVFSINELSALVSEMID